MVPDSRLNQLSAINNPEEVIPSIVEFVDIAGLVEGASQGEGLGNKFLANIRETDAIIHVVRCFEDKNVTHVSDEINPWIDFIRDMGDILVLKAPDHMDDCIRFSNVCQKLIPKTFAL